MDIEDQELRALYAMKKILESFSFEARGRMLGYLDHWLLEGESEHLRRNWKSPDGLGERGA